MERDALVGKEHEKKVEKVGENESLDPASRHRLDSEDGFLECQPRDHLNKEDKKRIINSVKLTKALVLLGYSCWSQLEPGKKNIFHIRRNRFPHP